MNAAIRCAGMLLGVSMLCSPLRAQTDEQMENLIRDAYHKIPFLAEFTVYSGAAMELQNPNLPPLTGAALEQAVKDAGVRFEISDFKVGTTASIAEKRWEEMITVPTNSERGVYAQRNQMNAADDRLADPATWKLMVIRWRDLPFVDSSDREQMADFSVREMLAILVQQMGDPTVVYDRYISYVVTIFYDGKKVGPYNALFLLGRNAKGGFITLPEDLYVQGLETGLTESFYPTEFFHTYFREKPVMLKWLNATQMAPGSCRPKPGDLCCSEERCGIASADLRRDLSTPLHLADKAALQP